MLIDGLLRFDAVIVHPKHTVEEQMKTVSHFFSSKLLSSSFFLALKKEISMMIELRIRIRQM